MSLRTHARNLGVAARLGARAWRRRLTGRAAAADPPDAVADWRAGLEAWLRSLPTGTVADHRFVDIPATRPPWTDVGWRLDAGDLVTWLATGRVYLSRALDLWVPPSFQLWARVGPAGPVFRGTRATHTFGATSSGPLQLASYFPGEWSAPDGTLGAGAGDYHKMSGGLTTLLVRWSPGVDVARLLQTARGPAPVRAEAARLASVVRPPDGWEYLWYLGPAEIFRAGEPLPSGRPTVCCDTQGDVGILRRPVAVPLEPGVTLDWRWRVGALPADLREDTLPSHDYLSIAVEFDDGQDLTYYWSAGLPVGTVYRCPLPTWKDKETHVVVRSGTSGLGRWLDETRDVHADYHRMIGGPARSIVRVWLIANSLFLRGRGRCEYAGIELGKGDAVVKVL
jgi:hypothetical protein